MIKRFWKKLDSFILWKFLSTFLFAILILAVIACVIDYSQKVDDLVKNHAPAWDTLLYFLNFIPHISALLFPLFIFISTIFFTSKMAYRSEIIAMLAAGISFRRFLRPYIVGSIILGIVSLFANHWVVPMANKNINNFKAKYIWSQVTVTSSNLHLRLSPHLFIYLHNYNYAAGRGHSFTAEYVDGTLMKKKIMAKTASYDSNRKIWVLKNVVIRENDGLKEKLIKMPSLEKKYNFTPKDLDIDEDIKETMTTPKLIRYTNKQIERGKEDVNFFLLERYKRTAQPVAGFILCIIGACIASRKIRGGSGLHLALGIVISALYMLLLQFANTFSTNAGLNPFIAVWLPNLLFGAIALYLYKKQLR